MNRLRGSVVLLLCLIISSACFAGDMNRVVRDLELDLGVRHMHIPMMGAALFVGKVATGFQMPGVRLAIFEDQKLSEFAPEEINRSLVKALGPQWTPFIKCTTRYGEEQSWIYVTEDGKKLHMLIANVERNELNLVEVKVSDKQMRRWINDTDEMARHR